MLLTTRQKTLGFTLIEIMMVVLVVGIMASLVQFNFNTNRPEDRLKNASARFAGVFDLAAEYALLNNIEIGLIVTKNSYQFLGYDGVRWSDIPDQNAFMLYELPEGIEMTLALDDLPIEEPLLFNASAFTEQQEKDSELNVDEETTPQKKRIPQVYLLSGGDISAFSLTFHLPEQLAIELDLKQALAYRVTGLYSTPLTIEGPTLEP